MKASLALVSLSLAIGGASLHANPLSSIAPDLIVPEVTSGEAAPGERVRAFLPEHAEAGTLYHLIYLPTDWTPDRPYPVIFEYPGNRYRTSPGTQEGCELGYGLSGGKGVIWVCLPFVNPETGSHSPTWWGDVEATVAYAKAAVDHVCRTYGGNRDALFLAGFSRGAIACNYIGLHDDEIAALWRAFFCHSHYDGVKKWNYPRSDPASAAERLARLGSRAQFVSQERSVEATRSYLASAMPSGDFTFLSLPYQEHTANWTLRPVPEREILRNWFRRQVEAAAPARKKRHEPTHFPGSNL